LTAVELLVLEKARGNKTAEILSLLESSLRRMASGLSVNYRIMGVSKQHWVELHISGDDQEVLCQLIERKFGLAPGNISNLEVGAIYRGFVTEQTAEGLCLDLGVTSPLTTLALYPLRAMRAQLFNGEELPVKQVAREYCLHQDFPLQVRIVELNMADGKIEVELSEKQELYFKEWQQYPFDRIISIGALPHEIETAIQRLGLERDVVQREQRSLMVHVLTCKIGTDSPGVIAKLGLRLSGVKLFAFTPEIRRRGEYQ